MHEGGHEFISFKNAIRLSLNLTFMIILQLPLNGTDGKLVGANNSNHEQSSKTVPEKSSKRGSLVVQLFSHVKLYTIPDWFLLHCQAEHLRCLIR